MGLSFGAEARRETTMKSKGQRKADAKADKALAYPAQEFLLRVEGLDAAAIDAACAQGGAVDGGVPPAWTGLPRWASARPSKSASVLDAHVAEDFVFPTVEEGDFTREQDGRVFARGDALATKGIRDGDALKTLADVDAREGDLVIFERPGFGRLLRELRFVGGAALLCSANPERPAVPLEDGELSQLRVVVLAERHD